MPAPLAPVANSSSFLKLVKDPLRFRLFLLSKLPSAYFAGVRVVDANETTCRVKVPYKWFSKNPFHSTYFACLSMAAEMSTGVLAMAHLYKLQPPVSMLVAKVEGVFYKKATGITVFTCNEGASIKEAIAKAIDTGEPQQITVPSSGNNAAGELIAQFNITWSFKRK